MPRPDADEEPPVNRRTLLFAVFAFCLGFPAALRAQAPGLTYAVPSAVAPGQATDVTFTGTNLVGASGLWTSLPGTAALAPIDKNGTAKESVVYRLTIPADAPIGIGGVRVATGQGVSNLRLIMIDDLPTLTDNGKNKTIAEAQELNLPVAVEGACEAESYDFYKFTAAKGQRVSVEVVARRLGSALDPVVRLLAANGREIAYSDDEPGLSGDSRFAVQIPDDGIYFLEVRDIQYAGSVGHRYRLRVGNFPLVALPYPLGAKRGTTAKVSFIGPSTDGLSPVDVPIAAQAGQQVSVSTKLPGGQGSAFTRLVVTNLDEALEAEPNDVREQSTPVTLPAAINGRLEKAKDRDFFKFEIKKGQRFQFTGLTRTLGSATDLFMRIYKADGASLAEVEDSGTEEGVLNFTAPDDGVFHLMVEDLVRRGGPGHAYRVEVETYQPGFSLYLDLDKFDAPKNGVFVAKVTATRRDYNGPITIELDGAGEGFVLSNNVIAEGKPDTTISVTLPDRLQPGQMLNLGIVGKAKIGEVEFATRAKTHVALQKQFVGLNTVPAELLASVGMGVGPVFPDFFKLTTTPVQLPRLVGTGTFKVKAEKLNKFDDPIALAIEGLPAGVTAEVKPIEKGKPEVDIVLKGSENLPLGDHKFKLTGTATFQSQPKQVVLGEVALKVINPLVVAAAPAGTIAPGGKQKVKVTITRFGDHKAPVSLAWKVLPAGITLPESGIVAEGKNEVEIEVSAASNAMLGKSENLVLVATTKFKDQDIVVESSPVVLEVKAP